VENQADSDRYIKARDVERLLGATIYHHLPSDSSAVTYSIRMGKPLMYCVPLSPLTQSYWQLVGRYTNRDDSAQAQSKNQPASAQEGKKSRGLSWLLDLGGFAAHGSK
jgi:pilus assembly protein CpaE